MRRSDELEQQWQQLSKKTDAQPSHIEGFANKNVQEAIDVCEQATLRDMTLVDRLFLEAELKRLRDLQRRAAEEAASRRR